MEHWQLQRLADGVVLLAELLQLFSCKMKLFSTVRMDIVDDQVGVDVLPVYMGADQNLSPVKAICQLPCREMGQHGVHRLPLGEGLDAVEELNAALLVVEKLGAAEAVVGAFRLAVDPGNERMTLPGSFELLLCVTHNRRHAAPVLAFWVVGKM